MLYFSIKAFTFKEYLALFPELEIFGLEVYAEMVFWKWSVVWLELLQFTPHDFQKVSTFVF